MSNPLPIPTEPTTRSRSAPDSIEKGRYPGLDDLRKHCSRDGIALIDRAYRDAQALYRRALQAEAELALYDEARCDHELL